MATAVLAAAVAVFLWTALPPKQLALAAPFDDGSVPGILHVHSVRSDGRGTPDDIARAAAHAGLKFVVITDHGDGTRAPDPPVYRDGVLCLEGTEISTAGGHYIAIDMPASPYPLGGEPRDVVEDVKRLGGFGIAAHPDSPKPELRWREWTAPFDGLEIVNLDTAWRTQAAGGWRGRAGLLARALTYGVRPAESIASLVRRSDVLYRWDALSRRRHVVTIAGADAHAQIGWKSGDPIPGGLSVPLPSYESSFRALSVHVRTERALTGTAAADAAMIVRGIRAGHLYTAIDGIATPPAFEFTAENPLGTVRSGDQLAVAGPVTLHVRSDAPDGFTTTVWDGMRAIVADRREPDFTITAPAGPAVYWVEVRAPGSRAPWITSNPIYVRAPEPATPAVHPRPPATSSRALFDGGSLASWTIEHDPSSTGAVQMAATPAGESGLGVEFGLSGGARAGQFAALVVTPPGGLAPADRLSFAARAERPMRISVQLRTTSARWERSVYVDTFSQPHTIFFDEFAPAGDTPTYRVPASDVRAVLFVVDTTNTKPGTSGRLWITSPKLEQ